MDSLARTHYSLAELRLTRFKTLNSRVSGSKLIFSGAGGLCVPLQGPVEGLLLRLPAGDYGRGVSFDGQHAPGVVEGNVTAALSRAQDVSSRSWLPGLDSAQSRRGSVRQASLVFAQL